MLDVQQIQEPHYTMRWLVTQVLIMLGISVAVTLVSLGIDSLALSRNAQTLLDGDSLSLVTRATGFCFAISAISLMSVTVIELASRTAVNYVQYGLIGCALLLFFLLLLSMAEKMNFVLAYSIVSVMTVGLITAYMWGITHSGKYTALTASVIVVEYALLLGLLYLGSAALLIGSLVLFILLGVTMYFTLKLKVENEELVLK